MLDAFLYLFAVVGIITTGCWLWKKLDVLLDKLPDIIIVPEETAAELKLYFNTPGT